MGTCGWKRLSMPSLKPGGSPDFKCTSALICFDLQEIMALQSQSKKLMGQIRCYLKSCWIQETSNNLQSDYIWLGWFDQRDDILTYADNLAICFEAHLMNWSFATHGIKCIEGTAEDPFWFNHYIYSGKEKYWNIAEYHGTTNFNMKDNV